jgi:hypothetical protein
MRNAYFHEDTYCQIELVCEENERWCIDQTRAIEEFAKQHRLGDAYTSMYVRPANPVELATRGITLDALRDAVSPHLRPFDDVKTGYSTVVEDAPDTVAFGFEPNVILFAAHAHNIVAAVWLTLQPSEEAEGIAAAKALAALSPMRLLLVDWEWARVIALKNDDAIDEYLGQRLQVFRDLYERFRREREAGDAPPPRPHANWWTRLRRWIG